MWWFLGLLLPLRQDVFWTGIKPVTGLCCLHWLQQREGELAEMKWPTFVEMQTSTHHFSFPSPFNNQVYEQDETWFFSRSVAGSITVLGPLSSPLMLSCVAGSPGFSPSVHILLWQNGDVSLSQGQKALNLFVKPFVKNLLREVLVKYKAVPLFFTMWLTQKLKRKINFFSK